jgi:hypothetical protein
MPRAYPASMRVPTRGTPTDHLELEIKSVDP